MSHGGRVQPAAVGTVTRPAGPDPANPPTPPPAPGGRTGGDTTAGAARPSRRCQPAAASPAKCRRGGGTEPCPPARSAGTAPGSPSPGVTVPSRGGIGIPRHRHPRTHHAARKSLPRGPHRPPLPSSLRYSWQVLCRSWGWRGGGQDTPVMPTAGWPGDLAPQRGHPGSPSHAGWPGSVGGPVAPWGGWSWWRGGGGLPPAPGLRPSGPRLH